MVAVFAHFAIASATRSAVLVLDGYVDADLGHQHGRVSGRVDRLAVPELLAEADDLGAVTAGPCAGYR